MNIDKDAENYRKGIDELLKEKENELEKTISDMKTKFQEESKIIKSSIINEKLSEAEFRAKNIIKEKEEEINMINVEYEKHNLQIVEDVFNGIIKSL
jgi:hypothetical protein